MEDGDPNVKLTGDGLHLRDTILSFDSSHCAGLSFLSAPLAKIAFPGPKVIATEVTIKMLQASHRRPKALVCQYNRPFSIGKLKLELLPSGSTLGGASLHVENGKNTNILYAPQLLSQKNETVRQMQLRQANTLILWANHPDPAAAMPNRKKEKDRLQKAVESYVKEGTYPVILCKAMPTAQEITCLFSSAQIPLAVYSSIFRTNQIYEQFGSYLGSYSLYRTKKKRQKTLLFPLRKKSYTNFSIPDGPVFYVEDTKNETVGPEAFRNVNERFFIGSTCDGRGIREVIQLVKPREVLIFGPYAKRYVDLLQGIGPNIKALYSNDQPTLF